MYFFGTIIMFNNDLSETYKITLKKICPARN